MFRFPITPFRSKSPANRIPRGKMARAGQWLTLNFVRFISEFPTALRNFDVMLHAFPRDFCDLVVILRSFFAP
jgi:hypothetical protein